MKRFKSIILPFQGKNKSNLHWLYNIQYNHTLDEQEEKKFSYNNLKFWYGGIDRRNSEKLLMFISIPKTIIKIDFDNPLPLENFLLGYFSPVINELSYKYVNLDKSLREKAQFSAQVVNEIMIKRNGLLYNKQNECFVLKLNFNVPLLNAISINAKATVRAVKDILEHIENAINMFDKIECQKYIDTYSKQQQIRRYLNKNHLCAFIADGSILPREGGTMQPMKNAIPFLSPETLRVTIPFSDNTIISGMAIKQGVTVITGGGYSGKSTLLNSIEMGIYNHIPGDGREYALTDDTAIKIYAEDGRPVHNIDISPFFKYLPNGINIKDFSTDNSSGSVSQATNIIEAICGRSNLLLIDEDRSATNFMIRDKIMRKLIKNEPIIPFTDRVRELYTLKGVSTILVIGGTSEYLRYADTTILMNDYVLIDMTNDIKNKFSPHEWTSGEMVAEWMKERYLKVIEKKQFLVINFAKIENKKKIILDNYSSDITYLTSLVSDYQINTLTHMIKLILNYKGVEIIDIIKFIYEINNKINLDEYIQTMLSWNWWYEEIRPIDIFCCVNRMRGLEYIERGDAK